MKSFVTAKQPGQPEQQRFPGLLRPPQLTVPAWRRPADPDGIPFPRGRDENL